MPHQIYPGYQRDGITPEPHDGDFYMGQFTATGALGKVNVLVTTSSIYQEAGSLLDASAAAPQFGLQGNVGYEDDRTYHLFNQELRLNGSVGSQMDWLAGAALLSARSHVDGTVVPETGTSIPQVTLAQHVQELAAFGELRTLLFPQVHATAGLRVANTAANMIGGNVRPSGLRGAPRIVMRRPVSVKLS